MDNLGTITNYNNAAVAELQAKIEQQRTIALNPKSTQAQKQAANKLIKQYEEEIRRLNNEILKAGETAASKLIAELAKNPRLNEKDIEDWLYMKAHGTLGNYIKTYANQHSSTKTHTGVSRGNRISGPTPYSWTETRWEEGTQEIYNSMQAVLAASEDEGKSYSEWLKVRTANAQRIIQQEKENQRNNKLSARVEKTESPKVKIEPEIEPIPEGSIKELETAMAELKKKFSLATTDEERAAIKEQIKTLQGELDRMNGVEIKPEIKEGSIAYIQQQIRELTTELENTPDATVRIKLQADIADLQKQLKEMQTTDAERAAESLKKKYEELQNQVQSTASVFSSLGSIFNSLGDTMGEEGQKVLQVIGTVMNGIATLIPQIAALTATEEAEAMASGTASAAKLPYPANLAAIASIVATIMGVIGSIASIASSSKFADGGIFQGSTTIGDYNLARVNAGEMILNNRQQKHLFNLLNGNTQVNAVTDGGNVTFTIHGSDLQGTLNNYNKRVNRVR